MMITAMVLTGMMTTTTSIMMMITVKMIESET